MRRRRAAPARNPRPGTALACTVLLNNEYCIGQLRRDVRWKQYCTDILKKPDECEVGHRELGQRGTRPILTCSHSRPVINQTRVLTARTRRVVRCAVVWRVSECHHSRTFSKLFNFSLFNFSSDDLFDFSTNFVPSKSDDIDNALQL